MIGFLNCLFLAQCIEVGLPSDLELTLYETGLDEVVISRRLCVRKHYKFFSEWFPLTKWGFDAFNAAGQSKWSLLEDRSPFITIYTLEYD